MHSILRFLLPTLLFLPLTAHSTTVTTTTDEDNGTLGGGTGVSLREAVKYSPAGDIITFAPPLSGQIISEFRRAIKLGIFQPRMDANQRE